MFVTHKFQPYTLLKLPNFEQNSTKFLIQSPWAMFPKEQEKALGHGQGHMIKINGTIRKVLS